MDDSFKFFVDQVVGQYRELKADIKADMTDIKDSMKEHWDEQEQLKRRVQDLERYRSYIAGAAAVAVVVVELASHAIRYWIK